MQPSTQIQCSTDVKTLQQTKLNPVTAWLSNDTTHEPDERLHDEAPSCCYLQQQDHQRPFAAAAAAHGTQLEHLSIRLLSISVFLAIHYTSCAHSHLTALLINY